MSVVKYAWSDPNFPSQALRDAEFKAAFKAAKFSFDEHLSVFR